ncbi:MAG: FtsW/RodA/SpoVE family cell cycle protein, partial [Alphaproteobacteria bacterium]|nr:FtsW/RodA/SpoVE family cell cycle protein [Alphaproteobacteria bacterium]
MSFTYSRQYHLSFSEKLTRFSLSLFWGVVALCGVSILMLYSVGEVPCAVSNCEPSFGNWNPYAFKQLVRFGIGFGVFFILAFSSLRNLMKHAYTLYGLNLLLLLIVTLVGHTGMGAQRWISIAGFIFQPSEPMKVTLVLALARYFSSSDTREVRSVRLFLVGLLITALPFALVLTQPDLGTALILAMLGGVMFFISGVPMSRFGALGLL